MLDKIKSTAKWVGTDGLLHFLVCFAMMLALTPILGVWWALLITCIAALAKEAFDYFVQKDNDKKAVLHDIFCDAAGIIFAVVTMAVWWVCNL